jgi:hypothetical protein
VSGIIFFRFKINTLESQITKKHVNASKPVKHQLPTKPITQNNTKKIISDGIML